MLFSVVIGMSQAPPAGDAGDLSGLNAMAEFILAKNPTMLRLAICICQSRLADSWRCVSVISDSRTVMNR